MSEALKIAWEIVRLAPEARKLVREFVEAVRRGKRDRAEELAKMAADKQATYRRGRGFFG